MSRPLSFDERGLLPPGVHDATFAEVSVAFGRFQRTDRRLRLVAGLRRYLDALRQAGIAASLVLDGSFVMTSVDEPGDIDAVLILPADWDLDADLPPATYNLLSRRRAKADFQIEVFPAVAGSADERYWLGFFGQVNVKWSQEFGWPVGLAKGLVRVTL